MYKICPNHTSKQVYTLQWHTLKGDPSKDPSWPEKAAITQAFPLAGIVWFFNQYLGIGSMLSFFVVVVVLL